jgi:hypothetical protein
MTDRGGVSQSRKKKISRTNMTNGMPPSTPTSFKAARASSAIGMARLLLRWISFVPVPEPASCSARLTSPSCFSSSVRGASSAACASCFLNPAGVSSSAVVAKMDSRKCSPPSSRTRFRRVDANSIFCRTCAASGTYVTADKYGVVEWRRRMM